MMHSIAPFRKAGQCSHVLHYNSLLLDLYMTQGINLTALTPAEESPMTVQNTFILNTK